MRHRTIQLLGLESVHLPPLEESWRSKGQMYASSGLTTR